MCSPAPSPTGSSRTRTPARRSSRSCAPRASSTRSRPLAASCASCSAGWPPATRTTPRSQPRADHRTETTPVGPAGPAGVRMPPAPGSAEHLELHRVAVHLAAVGGHGGADREHELGDEGDEPQHERQRDEDHREQADPADDDEQPHGEVEVERAGGRVAHQRAALAPDEPHQQGPDEAQPAGTDHQCDERREVRDHGDRAVVTARLRGLVAVRRATGGLTAVRLAASVRLPTVVLSTRGLAVGLVAGVLGPRVGAGRAGWLVRRAAGWSRGHGVSSGGVCSQRRARIRPWDTAGMSEHEAGAEPHDPDAPNASAEVDAPEAAATTESADAPEAPDTAEAVGSAEAQDAAVAAYWDTARKRAGLTRLDVVVGQQALGTVQPPAWSFGADAREADELLELVLAGRKTATASAAEPYEVHGIEVPAPGDLSIILDGAGRPRALIVTTEVAIVAFRRSEEHTSEL